MKSNLIGLIGAMFVWSLALGQNQNPVPNPGFENWTDEQPDEWSTSNVAGGANPGNVTPTIESHTGDFALKGEVLVWPGTPGFPYIPVLESNTEQFGFPIGEAYNNLSLYYQFHSAGEGDIFSVFVGVADEQGNVFGGGFVDISDTTDGYTLLNLPLIYAQQGVPSLAFISMTINNNSETGLPHIGSYFIVDDISLNNATTPVKEWEQAGARFQKVFPNPAADELTVAFSLLENSVVSIGIYDLLGRRVTEIFSGNLQQGDHQIPTSVKGLPGGLYLCRLSTPNGSTTTKLRLLNS